MVIHKELIDIDDLLKVVKNRFDSCERCDPDSKVSILDLFIEIQDKDHDLCHSDCTFLKKEEERCSLSLNEHLIITTHGFCRCARCKKYFGDKK